MVVPISILLAVLLQIALPLFVAFRYTISRIAYLFKIDEKRGNITPKTEFDL
jgi:hypothetical protein